LHCNKMDEQDYIGYSFTMWTIFQLLVVVNGYLYRINNLLFGSKLGFSRILDSLYDAF